MEKELYCIVIQFFKGSSLCNCDAIYRQVFLFVCSMNHIPPYLFLSREDDDDVRDIGKQIFDSGLLHPMLSNANLKLLCQCASTDNDYIWMFYV